MPTHGTCPLRQGAEGDSRTNKDPGTVYRYVLELLRERPEAVEASFARRVE